MIKNKATKQQLYAIYHLIINQRIFKYGMKDLFKYLVRCFCLRKTESLRSSIEGRQDYFLNQGKRKLERDLDVVNYLNLVKGFRLIRQVLFN